MRRLLLSLLALMPILSHADTATFQVGENGYNGENDNFLNSNNPTTSLTSGSTMGAGYEGSQSEILRSLIRFDLSSFAGEYTSISQVSLTLFKASSQGTNLLQLSEVSAANSGWVNSTSTWNNENQNTSTAWTGGVGLGAPGGGGYGGVLATYNGFGSTGSVTFTITDPTAATNLINDFTSANNPGFIVTASNESSGDNYILFEDRHVVTGNGPLLTITYNSAVPEPSSVLLFLGGLVGFSQRRKRAKL